MIVLDTNIVIGYIAGGDMVLGKWLETQTERGEQFALSAVSVVELLGFAKITELERSAIAFWMQRTRIIAVDHSLAIIASNLRRDLRLSTTDSIIAATAVVLDASLATRDKDLKRVRAIKVISP